jgi:hypothetical protein
VSTEEDFVVCKTYLVCLTQFNLLKEELPSWNKQHISIKSFNFYSVFIISSQPVPLAYRVHR